MLVTPLQMAMVAGAVANGGREMKPYLVDKTLAPDLTTLQTTSPEEMGRPIDGNVASQLTQMMQSVVHNGTGTAAQLSVPVAGKTGIGGERAGPADPRLVHRLRAGGQPAGRGGGHRRERRHRRHACAAPIARQVMSTALGLGLTAAGTRGRCGSKTVTTVHRW